MSGAVNVNGRITPEDQAVMSVFDHGFLYGEGVYEVCRTYRGRPFLLDRHMHRLRTSAGAHCAAGAASDDEFETRISDTMAAAGCSPGGPAGPTRTSACCSRAASASSPTTRRRRRPRRW